MCKGCSKRSHEKMNLPFSGMFAMQLSKESPGLCICLEISVLLDYFENVGLFFIFLFPSLRIHFCLIKLFALLKCLCSQNVSVPFLLIEIFLFALETVSL